MTTMIRRTATLCIPHEDATWQQIDTATKGGQTVDVTMQIDLLGIDARGGTSVVASVDAAGSFTK